MSIVEAAVEAGAHPPAADPDDVVRVHPRRAAAGVRHRRRRRRAQLGRHGGRRRHARVDRSCRSSSSRCSTWSSARSRPVASAVTTPTSRCRKRGTRMHSWRSDRGAGRRRRRRARGAGGRPRPRPSTPPPAEARPGPTARPDADSRPGAGRADGHLRRSGPHRDRAESRRGAGRAGDPAGGGGAARRRAVSSCRSLNGTVDDDHPERGARLPGPGHAAADAGGLRRAGGLSGAGRVALGAGDAGRGSGGHRAHQPRRDAAADRAGRRRRPICRSSTSTARST